MAIISAFELAAKGRSYIEVASLLRKTEKAWNRESQRNYKNPTLFRFYRAMDAYEKLEKIKASGEILNDAEANLYCAFGKSLPLIEEKTSKISVGGIMLGVWILVTGHKTLSKKISTFREKMLGIVPEKAND